MRQAVKWGMRAAAAGLCGAAWAGRETNGVQPLVLDPITVTARGHAVSLSKTPGSVGIVTSKDIVERQAASVPNLLELVPGVSKTSDSAWSSEVNIRGLSHDAVIFLIDGCRVNTATDINARFGLIDPLEVERIEILKGPISSLYGSGSLGGVVNVITRGGRFAGETAWKGGLSVYGESNPGGLSSFGFAGVDAPNGYGYASQTYRDFDSYKDGDGVEMRNSQFRDYQTTVKLGHRFNARHRLEGQFQLFEGREVGIPGMGTAPLPANADVTYPRVERELGSLTYTYEPGEGWLNQSQTTVYYQGIDRRVRIDRFPDASPVVEIRPQAQHETLGGKWQNVVNMGDHTVVAGVDVWQRQLTSSRTRALRTGAVQNDIPLPDSSFTSSGVFVEDSWDVLEKVTLSAGGRADRIDVRNDATDNWTERSTDEASWNAHVGATLALSEKLNTKAIVARGYRAASLEERYQYIVLGGGVTKWGNPELEPEESTFVEWGLSWLGRRVAASLSVFRNELSDLIAEERVSPERIENRNVSTATIQGAEAEMRWRVAQALQCYGHVAYARGRDSKADEDLAGISPVNGLAGIRYDPSGGFWGCVEMVAAASQKNTPANVEESRSWQKTDLRVGYDLATGRVEQRVYAGVNNVFDRVYREYLSTSRGFDFNEPGRSFVCGYSVVF